MKIMIMVISGYSIAKRPKSIASVFIYIKISYTKSNWMIISAQIF